MGCVIRPVLFSLLGGHHLFDVRPSSHGSQRHSRINDRFFFTITHLLTDCCFHVGIFLLSSFPFFSLVRSKSLSGSFKLIRQKGITPQLSTRQHHHPIVAYYIIVHCRERERERRWWKEGYYMNLLAHSLHNGGMTHWKKRYRTFITWMFQQQFAAAACKKAKEHEHERRFSSQQQQQQQEEQEQPAAWWWQRLNGGVTMPCPGPVDGWLRANRSKEPFFLF